MTRRRTVLAFAHRHWATFFFSVLALGILSWVSWDAFEVRSVTYIETADYWEHSAALHELIARPWHPQNPHLHSQDSSPRFGPQLLALALVARVLHWPTLLAMSFLQVFDTVLFLGSIFYFFRGYFRDSLAPLYGLVVMFASWWNAWPFSNVYQLKVYFSVATYPSTTALGTTLLGLGLVVRTLRCEPRRPKLALAAIVVWAGAVMIIHQLTAMLSLSAALLLALAEPKVRLRLRAEVAAAVVLGALLCHFWPYFSPWEVLLGGKSRDAHWIQDSATRAVQVAADTARAPRHRHFFYKQRGLIAALGLSLLGLVSLPYFLLRRERWFVSLGALSMLLPFVVNAYVDLPLGHRFILLAMFYLQVAVVWLLLLWTPNYESAVQVLRRRWAQGLAAVSITLLLGVFAYHNVLLARAVMSPRHFRAGTGSPVVNNARSIAASAGPNAVVLGPAQLSWPLPTFGPKIVSLLHANPLVPDESARAADVARFLQPRARDDERRAIIARYGVTHVLLGRTNRGSISDFLNKNAELWLNIRGGSRLYRLKPRPFMVQ